MTSTRQHCCTTRASMLSRCVVYAQCHSSPVPMLCLQPGALTCHVTVAGLHLCWCVHKQRSVSWKAHVSWQQRIVKPWSVCVGASYRAPALASWPKSHGACAAEPHQVCCIASYFLGWKTVKCIPQCFVCDWTAPCQKYALRKCLWAVGRAQRGFCCGHPPSSHARQGPFAGPCDGRRHWCGVPIACCHWPHDVCYFGQADVQSKYAVSLDVDKSPVVVFDTK